MNIQSILGVIIGITIVTVGATTPMLLEPQPSYAAVSGHPLRVPVEKAPTAISGDNVYVTWWTNNTANNNDEVMFRASTDGG